MPEPSFWQERFETLQKEGHLFEIDLSLFGDLQPRKYNDGNVKLVRCNPATLTLLEMTPEKALLPILIRVRTSTWSARRNHDPRAMISNLALVGDLYERRSKDEAWLFALQAAKTSVTLYGIWIGHVYHWHLVPAAMVRTMKEAIGDKTDHPVRTLLYQHSDYVIEFNYVLLSDRNTWVAEMEIAPPTSLANAEQVSEVGGQVRRRPGVLR